MTDQEYDPVIELADPKLYLESFCKIKGKDPGLIPFILNEAQKDIFNTMRKYPRIIVLKARQIGFCVLPDTKVLLSNMTWKTVDEIGIGDKIVSVDEFPPGGKGSARKMREATVEAKWDVEETAYKISLDDGRTITLTGQHKLLLKKYPKTITSETEWRKTIDMKVGDMIRSIVHPWDVPDYEDGWFSGIIDGEGSLAKATRSGASLTISQVDGPVWERLLRYADRKGFSYRIEIDKRIAGVSSKLGSKQVNKLVLGNISDIITAIGQSRPSRMLSKENSWWNGKKLPGNGNSWAKIISIEEIGKRRMIDLQTSEKTFIANGLVSHNSTAITGFLYHKTITTPGMTTVLVGYNTDMAAELLDKVKTFWQSTPQEMRPTIQYNSKYTITFPKMNSKIMVLPSSENVGRGYTIHAALLTELAMWDKASEKMAAIENAVPQNGLLVVESTPRGVGNEYHRMWMAEHNGYEKKRYGWYWIYSEKEIEVIRQRMNDPLRFAQEYELEFLTTGRSVFDPNTIKKVRTKILDLGDKHKDADGKEHTVTKTDDGLIMYKEPQADKVYIVGADVSEGVTGGDFSAVTIFERTSGEEVAHWHGMMAPDKFGEALDKWGRLYNGALMVVEINNHGLTTLTILKQLLYPQLYFRPTKFDTIPTTWSDRLGWKTTKVTRPLMIDDLAQALREGDITVHTRYLVDEMQTFVYDNSNNMNAQDGYHDDAIFSAAIAFQGFKVIYDGKLDQVSYSDHLPSESFY